MPKKPPAINYTNRDYASIRRDLENYAKRYYPNTYGDFSEASFGSLMLDTVAYIGDILSFYVDYQANESFLDSAVQYDNVVRHARQFGFRLPASPSSYGMLTLYLKVPAATLGGGPDLDYAPILEAGSIFGSVGGGSYTLIDSINFAASGNQVVAAEASANGDATSYIIRAVGRAVSGRVVYQEVKIGAFQRFLKVPLSNARVADIVSVFDSEGHEYVQVDNLSQNTIYRAIRNTSATQTTVPSVLKAVPVARRFVLEQTSTTSFLQFGHGSDSELLQNSVLDPTDLMLDLHGRNYITDADFDPTKLISNDKLGIAPANTTLRIAYRINTSSDVNAAVNSILTVQSPKFTFRGDLALLSTATRATVEASLEVTNDEPFVGDISLPSSEEVKQRVLSHFATQNRAVTAQDYQSIVYGMPGKFGAIHRAKIVKDFDEFKKNLNLYVVSTDASGKLIASNTTLKNNVATWLSGYRMVNDTIDILDAEIINFGINYEVAIERNTSKFTVINRINTILSGFYAENQFDIGEDILLRDIYRQIIQTKGVLDVRYVEIVPKQGGLYSQSNFNFTSALSADGNYITAPSTAIFELKFPNVDIRGTVR